MIRLALIAFIIAGAAPRPAQIIPAVAVGACPGVRSGLDPARTPAPYRTEIGKALIGGVASWYAYNRGEAAAGKTLRRALGRDWRGQRVKVCRRARCVVVTLTDWMGHPRRLIDLSRESFARLANPAKGLVEVTIELP